MQQQQHIRGLRLVTPSKLNSQLHGWWQLFHRGTQIGQVILPHHLDTEHYFITGATGVGKSTMLRELIRQAARAGDAAVIIDPESDNVQEFYDETRNDSILNPLDDRCPQWGCPGRAGPWGEFRDRNPDMDIDAFVTALVEGGLVRDQSQKFWVSSGRTFIAELLKKVSSVDALLRFTDLPVRAMQNILQGTPAYRLIGPGAGQTQAVLSTVSEALKIFKHLPKGTTQRYWCAREWAENPKGWLFLSSKPENRAAALPIQALWLDAIARGLLNARLGSRKVWVFAEELQLMGYQPRIQDIATNGRKRGIALVLGCQNIAQLREIYGKDAAQTLTSQPMTRIFFSGGDSETNEWVSVQLGKPQVKKTQQSRSRSYTNTTTTEADHYISDRLVIPDEVEALPKGHAYVAIRGHNRTWVVFKNRPLKQNHPDFVPRGLSSQMIPNVSTKLDDTQPEPPAHASIKAKEHPTESIWSGIEARCRSRKELESGLYKPHKYWGHYGGRQRCIPCGYLYPGDGRKCPKCDSDQSKDAPVLLLFNSMDEIITEIGPRPSMKHTVDRKDCAGHYASKNVRWILDKDQAANRRNSKRVAAQLT